MKITVTFDSLEEFTRCVRVGEGFQDDAPASFAKAQERVQELKAEAASVATEPPAETETADNTPPAEPAGEDPKTALTEDFRVDVRKTLAKLNKHTGKNTALEIIKAHGYKSLKDVPLDELPAIMNDAKEALNA